MPSTLCALALLLTSLPVSQGRSTPTSGLAVRVEAERLVQTVRDLSEFGARMGGTEAGHRATAWRAKQLQALGLEVTVHTDPATWCHETTSFRLSAHAELPGSIDLGPVHPLGFSPSASGSARLALNPEAGSAWLTSSKPRAPKKADGPLPAIALFEGDVSLDGAWPVVSDLSRTGPFPYPVFGLSRPAGAKLRELLTADATPEGARGPVTLDYALETTIVRAQPRTVEAVLPAREGAPSGFLLYCAHGDSDSGGPGANDNGSGEAIVLEIAAAWKAAIDAGDLPAPAREVRFAIWGKEIHSTRAYLERVRERGETVLGVINFDQSGFGSSADRLYVEPDDLQANKELIGTFAALLGERAGTPGFPNEWATVKSLGGTDSYVFSGDDAFKQAGYPAVTVYISAWGKPDRQPRTPGMPGASWTDEPFVDVDYDAHYHSAGDTAANTTDKEPWGMAWCARVGWLSGLAWLDAL